MAAKRSTDRGERDGSADKRKYVSQSDVPAYSLEQAMRVPRAIADNYGKNPTKPLRVAEAMGMLPGSSTFRMLCGAAIAYGLTDGGYNSDLITITALGRRVVSPTREGDDLAAKREALLRPRVIRDFLTRYNESKLPGEVIGRNVLEELGVPAEKTQATFQLIVAGARDLGMLRDVKGQIFVDLDSSSAGDNQESTAAAESSELEAPSTKEADIPSAPIPAPTAPLQVRKTNRVFITHGRNREIVTQLKELLTFGGFTPIVAIEQETASKPVPDKVMDEMRTCDAAIIHIGTESKLLDKDGKEHTVLNQNVLIEIGAALALFGGKFILLVEQGVTLPSNLQGLYQVKFQGDKLDYEATMKLLKAFSDFRS